MRWTSRRAKENLPIIGIRPAKVWHCKRGAQEPLSCRGHSTLLCTTAHVADTVWGKGEVWNLLWAWSMFGPGEGSLKCCVPLGGCQQSLWGFATPEKEPGNTTALESAVRRALFCLSYPQPFLLKLPSPVKEDRNSLPTLCSGVDVLPGNAMQVF